MDRQIVYSGAIPLETDILNTNRNTLVALAKLSSALLGTATTVNGFSVAPTSPASMQVVVAPGEIYALANLDGTAYSSLAADVSHQVVKQGLALDSQTFTLATPTTSGQSICYLLQATYQDVDGNSTVLPYYNSSNPAQAYSGPANAGTAQNTVRQGAATLSFKAGVAATTGSQAIPSPDSGYVGLYVVTVAYGQTTITASNISQYAAAPLLPTGVVPAIQNGSLLFSKDVSTTANSYKVNLTPAVTSLVDGMVVAFQPANANTGAATLSLNGLTAYPVVGGAHQALQGGELVGRVQVMWHASLNSFVVLDSTGGAVQIKPGWTANHAATLGQTLLTVSSLTALRGLSSSGATNVYVTGYYSPGDGGGGHYVLVSATSSGYTDDGGATIIASDGGVWALQNAGFFTFEQFGAKGDGTTNDSMAMQQAINYLSSIGGGVLRGRNRVYYTGSTSLYVRTNNISMIGDPGASVIKASSSITSPIIYWGDGSTTPRPCQFILSGWVIDGGGSTSTGAHGVYLWSSLGRISDNLFRNCGGYGLYGYQCWSSWVFCNQFTGNGSGGMFLGQEANNIRVWANECNWNNGHGLVINGGMGGTYEGNAFEENQGYGVYILGNSNSAIRQVSLRQNYFENNGKSAAYPHEIYVDRSGLEVSSLEISRNYITNALSGRQLYIADVSSAVIENNQLINVTVHSSWENCQLINQPGIDMTLVDNTTYNTNFRKDANGYTFSGRLLNARFGSQEGNDSAFGTLFGITGRYAASHFPSITIGDITWSWGSSAPTVGTYSVGSICWNNLPTAGGVTGWQCVASGTPGTWKSFGVIAT